MLRTLGYQGIVPSPTYTLVEPYQIDDKIIYHVDLYRIADENECEFLGWSGLRDGLLLIEWPERLEGLLSRQEIRHAVQVVFD